MPEGASPASAWRAELKGRDVVWTVEDDNGDVPAFRTPDGRVAMPFWSMRSRVEEVLALVPAYRELRPRMVPLEEFRSRWIDGLQRDGLLIGLNWRGAEAAGSDIDPTVVGGWLDTPD